MKFARAINDAQTTTSRDQILEVRFENKDREYRWYEVTINNMIKVPEINGIVITAHDIEQRMHATAHILASKRAAEKANEAKSEFLSRMSHELRTPLNAILGFGQLLEMEAISDRQAENVEQILIAGRHLLGLVNDILDIARIETRKVNLSVERVNVREIIEESFALLAPLSKKSDITLTFEEANCPDVWSDRQRLKQVFLNLLSNGIKYNRPHGNVTVSIERDSEGLKIHFRDSGIGIESQYLDRVFTPFDRLGSDNAQVEGSGLGLALSKTLIDAMGCKMELKSNHGVGTTFSIFFPQSTIIKPTLELIEKANQSDETGFDNPNNLRVLLIEDNIVNLRYISKFVEKLDGVALMSAKEGGIGIEMARLHQPDLILLDLDLPDINGQEVLSVLRADPQIGGTHIVVMSAETNPHIVEQTMALGAHKFVTKPVDVGSLFTLFDEEKKAA
jgi:signal transduction histidine kinase/CheY-like chemotaxis protein